MVLHVIHLLYLRSYGKLQLQLRLIPVALAALMLFLTDLQEELTWGFVLFTDLSEFNIYEITLIIFKYACISTHLLIFLK